MMNERQVGIAADLIVERIREALTIPTSVSRNTATVRIKASEILDRLQERGVPAGIWGLRHSFDVVGNAVCHRLDLAPETMGWQCDGRPALDKGYIFSVPVAGLMPADVAQRRFEERIVDSQSATALTRALAGELAANKRAYTLAEALALLCRSAVPMPSNPDVFLLERSAVLKVMEIIDGKTATTA